jgi:alpha-glucosidase
MDKFKVFTLGETFKLEDMRAFIDKLHANDQHYIVMVDPAVAAQNYSAYNNGLDADIFLKNADGSVYTGEVWPGVTAFPDWFHSNVQSYWDNEFAKFFDAETGIDIDALWIDMNEPSNFREYPPEMTEAKSIGVGQAGTRSSNTKEAVPHALAPQLRSRKAAPKPQARRSAPRQAVGTKKGLPGRDLMNPLYKIRNDVGSLSNRTADTDLIHQGGWAEYDTHNL